MKSDEKPFVSGEYIVFAGDYYKVVVNYGDSGTVRAVNDGGQIVTGFRWEFEGEKCRRVDSCEALRILDGV